MDKKMVEVVVFDDERYGREWPPEDAAGALAWLQSKIAEVPSECMASARIVFGSTVCYDSEYATIRITYQRPETDAELADRAANAKREAERVQQVELRQLAVLVAKYEHLRTPSPGAAGGDRG